MLAAAAGHVITAFVLVDDDCALWTLDSSIVFLPSLKIYIFFRLATLAANMRDFTAIETYLGTAGCTLSFLLSVHFSYIAVTGGLRAPSEIWIKVDHRIV